MIIVELLEMLYLKKFFLSDFILIKVQFFLIKVQILYFYS